MERRGGRYTIAGENNPYWLLVEPILLHVWADGLTKASSLSLQIVNGFSLAVHITMFVIGTFGRLAAVGAVLLICYALFPETLAAVLGSVLSIPVQPSSIVPSWPDQLLGYVIIVTATLFVLGNRLFGFLGESFLYVLFAVTLMAPLRLLALGLRNENYLAQAIAKSSFMGMYISQSLAAMPNETTANWDRVFDLYMRSNTLLGREQLEEFVDDWSKKPVEDRRTRFG